MSGILAFALLVQVAGATPAEAVPAATQPAAYGPAAPAPPPRKPTRNPAASDNCASERRKAGAQDVIVCAPPGFRLDPDVLAAKKAMKRGSRPTNPHESFKDKSCGNIGPMGCRGVPTVDLIRVATVVGTMAAKASRGENVGEMFVTDPQPTEYGLYLEAKAKREATEAAAAAKVAAAKVASPAKTDPAKGDAK